MPVVRNAALLTLATLALSACNREPSGQPDDFAKRIGAENKAGAPSVVSTTNPQEVAAERAQAVKNGAQEYPETSKSANKLPYADLVVPPSVQADAKGAEPCRAVAMTAYLGKPDSPDLRQAIATANKAPGGMRVMVPGQQVTAGEKPTRLNVMLDNTGVVRDFRCG